MAIEPLAIPDLKLESLSKEDQAALDAFLLLVMNKINDIIVIANANHP